MVFLPVDNYKSIILYVLKNDNSHGVFAKQISQKDMRSLGPNTRTCAVDSNKNVLTLKQSFCEK